MNTLTREQRRAMQQAADKENQHWPVWPKEIFREDWPVAAPPGLERVWRSRQALVQLYQVPGQPWPDYGRLSIQRVEAAWFRSDKERAPGFSWEELQLLKAQCGFSEKLAIELFPPQQQVVNVAPMRHLWLVPPGFIPFVWGGV